MVRIFQLPVFAALSLLGLSSLGATKISTSPPASASDKTNWWAFAAPAKPFLPEIQDAPPPNPIDRFVRAILQKQHLSPAPEADRRTLIRRLAFDLTGLPPSPEELEDFVSDRRPDAWERLVDRLLASPRYGERWARHWLDVVHYAETHGYDKDKPRRNAWPYRDYVIQSLNGDKSYSRFVQEQVAGDILFPDEPDAVAATGFLAAGPWDFVGHVELPITKTDGLIARYNDRDDMIMNTMSSFLSLTVHCARCHDHKFDPITQREYYSLQAVFAGVDRADRPYDLDAKTARARRQLLEEQAALQKRLTVIEAQRTNISNPRLASLNLQLEKMRSALADLERTNSPGNGYHSVIETSKAVSKWVQIDLGKPLSIEKVRLVPARPTDFPDTPGFGFPGRFRIEISNDPDFAAADLVADSGAVDYPNPGDHAVDFAVDSSRSAARFVRFTATHLWPRTGDFVFALAELQVFSGATNVALHAGVTALDSIEAGRWGKKRLVDGFDSRNRLDNPMSPVDRKLYQDQIAELSRSHEALIDQAFPPEEVRLRNDLLKRLAAIASELKRLPAPKQTFAATHSFQANGNFVPAVEPRPVHFLNRGDVKRPGDIVSPGTLAFLPGLAGTFSNASALAEGDRRAALARWLTDRRNLLLRRSIVNRVWHYHFGRGIVDSPNDFGHMGSLPSHPELLDWLAHWFLENGESLKKLHRLIVTSQTYRQSSSGNPDNQIADSGNRYLWRMNRARLDAESLHDTILAISGKLDLTAGGPSVELFDFKDDHSPVYDYVRFDPGDSGHHRRSIYRFIVRSVPDPLMDVLDCPDGSIPTPVRMTTTTALQALATLNDPFILLQSGHFARRIDRDDGDLSGAVDRALLLALGRHPSPQESEKLTRFAAEQGLPAVCRLIFNLNEFLFID